MYRSLIGCVLAVVVPQIVRAVEDEVKMAVFDYPPFSNNKSEPYKGYGVELLREIAKRKNIKQIEIQVEINRLPELTEQVVVFALVSRNPTREKQVQWIGKMANDHFCMATLKSKGPVTSVEQAKALKSVAVNTGGAMEMKAKSLGLQNLDGSLGNGGNVRKLFAGAVDGWFTTHFVSEYSVREHGQEYSQILCPPGNFSANEYYIAASKKMPETLYKKYVEGFNQLKSEGFVDKLIPKAQ